ncbi:MAG: hypothetical protein M1834_006262 [Cirrosporium novae-zelandiae]|nr:MAG: hypothetical protein M1834_006262 [Cirrosporium novae-zelandiae]
MSEMGKRQAQDDLQTLNLADYPASKKVRIAIQRVKPNENAINSHHVETMNNGRSSEHDKPQNKDTLAAPNNLEGEVVQDSSRNGISKSISISAVGEEEDNEDQTSALTAPTRQNAPVEGYSDLYLDTINRSVLDFDFEKLCSVTLSNINVYACLVCGKYYQGRGPKSHAYFHALDIGHHVFVNMETKKAYVLPEGYEVKSKSLDDIKFVVDPRLSKEEVMKLDKDAKDAWDLSGKRYRPGFIGMNNIKENDYLNVIVQALSHASPIRNFFMLAPLPPTAELPLRFSTLIRKLWNPRAFKPHVSPHELLQEIAIRSSKRFTLTQQSDPVVFLAWFLNALHLSIGGSKSKPHSSIVQKTFQGRLQIESQELAAQHTSTSTGGDRLSFAPTSAGPSISTPHFLILTLDLPPPPLFQDALEKNIIPQIPLTTLLQKYNGVQPTSHLNTLRRHRLLHPLPPYLLIHIKRFTANKFLEAERNPTIVTFQPRSLDMSPFVAPSPSHASPSDPILYDLVANVVHEAVRAGKSDDASSAAAGASSGGGGGGRAGGAEKKVWKVQVKDRARGDEWLEIQDLWVGKVRGETLFTGESYLQVWERRRTPVKGKEKSSS